MRANKKPSGGIIAARSEMDEPIFKLAIRDVLLLEGLDDTILNSPKNNLQDALVLRKLNIDFQNPWIVKLQYISQKLVS